MVFVEWFGGIVDDESFFLNYLRFYLFLYKMLMRVLVIGKYIDYEVFWKDGYEVLNSFSCILRFLILYL